MAKFELRKTALEILVRVGEKGGFSNVLIDNAIKKNSFSTKDEGLLTEIIYGTLKRQMTLEFYLAPFIGNKKVEPWVKWLLYMSVYQMVYLDKVPDHAIIHESVEISKIKGHKGISSFVNGILRNIQRKGLPDVNEIEDPVKRIAIGTSHPEWLINRWVDMYGESITEQMAVSNLEHKPMSVRIQPLKITRKEAIEQLEEEGYQVVPSSFSNQGLVIEEGNILKSKLFRSGFLTVQDQSSMLVAESMDLKPGFTVLDACSAPGGKTTHIAEKMNNQGEIFAYDLHAKKINLVREKAEELNLSIIKAEQADARNLPDFHRKEKFDRILLDAPCSGLGVLRGKPDIKYNKHEKDIEALAGIQLELLNSVSSLLKKGGKLVYSTCTVDKQENERLIEKFITEHPDFRVEREFIEELPKKVQQSEGAGKWGLQLFPHQFGTDGFFLTRLVKEESNFRDTSQV